MPKLKAGKLNWVRIEFFSFSFWKFKWFCSKKVYTNDLLSDLLKTSTVSEIGFISRVYLRTVFGKTAVKFDPLRFFFKSHILYVFFSLWIRIWPYEVSLSYQHRSQNIELLYSQNGPSFSICLKLTYFMYFVTLDSNLTEKFVALLPFSGYWKILFSEILIILYFFKPTDYVLFHRRTPAFFGDPGRGVRRVQQDPPLPLSFLRPLI